MEGPESQKHRSIERKVDSRPEEHTWGSNLAGEEELQVPFELVADASYAQDAAEQAGMVEALQPVLSQPPARQRVLLSRLNWILVSVHLTLSRY